MQSWLIILLIGTYTVPEEYNGDWTVQHEGSTPKDIHIPNWF